MFPGHLFLPLKDVPEGTSLTISESLPGQYRWTMYLLFSPLTRNDGVRNVGVGESSSQTALVPIFAVIKFTHLRICRCEHADNELISNRDGGCALDDHTAPYSRGNSRRDYRPGAAIKT